MERLMHDNGRGSLTASLAETAKHYERGKHDFKRCTSGAKSEDRASRSGSERKDA